MGTVTEIIKNSVPEVNTGTENLHNGIRIHAVDAGSLAFANDLQTFHADLPDGLADRKNLGKTGHIQDFKNLRIYIGNYKIPTKRFFRFQKNAQTC